MHDDPAQKRPLLDLFPQAAKLANDLGRREVAERLDEAAGRLAEGRLLVVVCGEFKQGKSSLLNAILGEPGLFPTDIDIATNVVTTVKHGDPAAFHVVLGDPREERVESRPIRRDQIPDYATEAGNPKNIRGVRLLAMSIPNAFLQDGLTLVDTPGIGGLDARHTEVTYTFVPRADAILYVGDALRPLTADDLGFIRERIAPHCPNLINVVTKIDLVGHYAEVVEGNRRKLADATGWPENEVVVIPVSSRLKLQFLATGDAEDLADSHFVELEERLWRLLNRDRGRTLLLVALTHLGAGLAELSRPLDAELAACDRRSREQLDDLERRGQAALDLQKGLIAPDAPWRTAMRDGGTDIRARMPALFQEGIVQIRRRVNLLLDDAALVDEPSKIVDRVEVALDELMVSMHGEMERQAAQLRDGLIALTGFDVNPFEVGRLSLEKDDISADLARIRKPNWWQRSTQVVRATLSQTSLFAAIARLVTIPMDLGLGFFAFAGLLAVNTKDNLAQIHHKGRAEVRRIVDEYIENGQRRGNQAILATVVALERSVRDELDDQIRREREACDASLKSIKSARKLTQEQATRRASELKLSLQEIARFRRKVEELGTKLAGDPAPSTPRKESVAP